MAAQSFETAWRAALQMLPGVPPLLVRNWAADVYLRLGDRWGWSFLRGESAISTLASRTLTVDVTQGVTTIISAGAFLTSDEGRQFRVGTSPVYTIVSVADTSTATLDRAYAGETTAGATGSILSLYATMPADFRQFLTIIDPYNQVELDWTGTQEDLARIDPHRTNSDSGPRAVVSHSISPLLATYGQLRYELWPAPTSARQYPYRYMRTTPRPLDTDLLPGLLGQRIDLLKLGVQIEAAQWPGTEDKKNPFYSLPNAQMLSSRFETVLQELILLDDTQAPQQYQPSNYGSRYGSSLRTSDVQLRSSDATVGDYL